MSKITKKEIMKQLDEAEIIYDPKATRDELELLLPEPEDDVPEGIPHEVTEEDLEKNPELIKEGIEVGDTIYLPEEETLEELEARLKLEKEEEEKKKKKAEEKAKKTKLVKPGWVDPALWNSLNEKKRQKLVSGVSIANLNK